MQSLVNNLRRGYTMIEMLVVMSIIVIMSVALFANYREIGDQGRISSFAGKAREDLYLAQNYSLSGRTKKSDIPNGWGVYFNRDLSRYILFADLDAGKTYTYPTSLLIHGTETVASNIFTDSSQAANRVTVSNATRETTPGRPLDNEGYWSFGGAGYLSAAASNNFDFGSGDFAIDLWIYSTLANTTGAIMYKGDGASSLVFGLKKDSDNLIKFTVYSNVGTPYDLVSNAGIQAIATSTWYHVAVTKENNLLRLFIDGSVHQSLIMDAPVRSQSNNILIGITDATVNPWSGYLDEIRISKGASRWREKFSVPTVAYVADDEAAKTVKLPPGLVFDYLKLAGATTTELNVFFDASPNSTTTPPTYLMYGNNNSGNQEAQIIINNAGVAGTGQAGDTPQTLTIGKSGVINWTH